MAMADLGARCRSALSQHLADPLVLVPLVVLDSLCFHPFPDGNVRMAATSRGWQEAAHEIDPWLACFWGALLGDYKEFEERVGSIERGRGAKGARVRSQILKRQRPFSISEIVEACPGISRDRVRVILRAMKAEGLSRRTARGARPSGSGWMQVLKAWGRTIDS